MNVLFIALNGLGTSFRHREFVFWIFIGPLIFTTFFGILFKAQPARPPSLRIVNRDRTPSVAADLTGRLQLDGIRVTRTDTETAPPPVLVVPEGAAADWTANRMPALTLRAGAGEDAPERDLRFKIVKALIGARLGVDSASAAPLRIVSTDLGAARRRVTSGFQRAVPSFTVMFVFLNLLVSGVGLAEERRRGLLRRLAVAPVTKREIIFGKLLSRVSIGWMQIAWMLLVGRLVFGIEWAEHGWLLFGFLSLFALASASTGILLGTLFRDPDKCRSFAIWTAVLLAPLGGLWWPIEVVGPAMRQISYLVPTGWAMEPVNAMLAFGAGIREVAPFAAALAGLFMATFVLASRRLEAV